MRILVLNQYFHPDGASSAQLLTELCEDLSKVHEVWVITGRPSYNVTQVPRSRKPIARELHGTVKVLRVWSTSFPRANMPGRIANYVTYLLMSLAGAFRAPSPDVVMTWTDPPPIGLIGSWIARARRVPFVFSSQDIVPEAAVRGGELSNPLMIRLLRWVTDRIFRDATRVVSIGRDMNFRLAERGVPQDKTVLIPNWTDGALVHPLEGPSKFRETQGWGDRFVVMHSGNLGFSQDLDTLVDAAEVLASADPKILIAIVGDGASKSRLQAKVAGMGLKNVSFIPFQPKSQLGDLLAAPDLHIVSHKQGLPGFQVPSKLYGVLAAGKPFIAAVDEGSEIGIVADENDCGLRVDPGDAAALARAIRTLRDGPRLAKMGSNSRRAFEAGYTRERSTNAYRHLLEDLGPALKQGR